MYNKCIMMGRITHDLELKTTPTGTNVCTFSIAVDRRFQAKGEEKKTDFFNVVAWRAQADFVCNYFSKGRMIMVEGELQTRSYTNKDGVKINVTEIIADRLGFTGEKRDSFSGTSQGTPQGAPPVPSAPPAFEAAESDDDYPF